ncbi:hypothetical protein TSOC_011096 [Tetrabaena socialis]|uniref:Uncharacterized protein n=1 Tax=Tetrabaena socialis TaxID=47790 RepID=A0A2J7ZRJ4_9CHLO|nr:hypothetical protein TSOC_011096 [Tetrabaena socialis]|eukprot:PNH02894.1 hypothetical protein TSOC_011096 [Tetrabaena socialis]
MLGSFRGRQRPTGAEDPAQPQLPAAPGPNPNDGGFGGLGVPPPPADPFPGPVPSYAAPAAAPPASSLYGLAADLVGQQGTGQGGGRAGPGLRPGPGPGAGLAGPRAPPARLGPPRNLLAAPGAAASAGGALDPFSLAEARRRPMQHLPIGHIGERPYGLALELINNQEPGASFGGPLQPPDRLGSRSSRRSALESQPYGVARLGEPPPAAVHAQPPLDPFTVMELAAGQEGLPEPDYGLVAELRNRAPPDPFASDFGLVAEVARRRGRSPSPLGREELPDGPVRLKTPGDDASETSAVSGDDELYGIARELGVDMETARRIQQERSRGGAPLPGQAEGEQAEPPGHKTLDDEEDSDDEDEDKGFRGGLRRTLQGLVNVFNILGMFAQGLLGGFALLNFFMTYMLYGSSTLRKFLSYYAPIALDANRLYYTLLVLAIVSSTTRYGGAPKV